MDKNIKLESFRYHFLRAAEQVTAGDADGYRRFIESLAFSPARGAVEVAWTVPAPGNATISLEGCVLYLKGDSEASAQRQSEMGLAGGGDRIVDDNAAFFRSAVEAVVRQAGLATGS